MSLSSCKDTVHLLSLSLDRGLRLGQWLVMRLHLLGCPRCARYRRHLLLLRDTARRLARTDRDPSGGALPALSEEARARIKNACENPNL